MDCAEVVEQDLILKLRGGSLQHTYYQAERGGIGFRSKEKLVEKEECAALVVDGSTVKSML